MKSSILTLIFTVLFAFSAQSAIIQNVVHDKENDQLVIDVAYQGTQANHQFSLTWGACLPWGRDSVPYQTDAHLDDLDGNDHGRNELTQTLYFSLKEMNCRPSLTTIRLNRFSHSTLVIE